MLPIPPKPESWQKLSSTLRPKNSLPVYQSSDIAVVAAGTTQGTATALTKQCNFITSGSGGVKLPTPVDSGASVVYFVDNDISTALNIYPHSGGSIDGGTTNAPKSLAAGKVIGFISEGSNEWITISGSGAYIPSGDTLPTTGITDGQLFTHTPTGRSVWMKYNSTLAVWAPLFNEGTTTMYVDYANGTDSQNNGGATGTSAFKTRQFAVNQISGNVGGDVYIYDAGGTIQEQVTIQGKYSSGNYTLYIIGTMTTQTSGTITSATDYSSGTQATITKTAAGWTVNAYADYVFRITGGTGYDATNTWKNDYVIESNTATVLTLIGKFFVVPDATTTYQILSFASIADGNSHTLNSAFIPLGNQMPIIIKQFKTQNFKDTHFYPQNGATYSQFTTHSVIASSGPNAQARGFRSDSYCVHPNLNCLNINNSAVRGFSLLNGSRTAYDAGTNKYGLTNSLIKAPNPVEISFNATLSYGAGYGNKFVGTTTAGTVLVGVLSVADFLNTIITTSATGTVGISVEEGSVVRLRGGCDIFGHTSHGISIDSNSVLWAAGSGSKSRNNGGWGLYTSLSSVGKSVTTNITYSGNTLGTYTADASSINS